MRNQIAVANWKMNLTRTEGQNLLDALLKNGHILGSKQIVIFAVPYPYLPLAQEEIQDSINYFVGAQNCSSEKSGAYTGEVSVTMLSTVGAEYVIIGHSERREYFHENNEILKKKIDLCLQSGLKAIFCCGEPLTVRSSGTQDEYIKTQIIESIFHLEGSQLNDLIIAYEPIWAIGTGKTATVEQAQNMHAHIRKVMAEKYGDISDNIPILYGGSVKASNALELFSQPDVDGGLVGGASLDPIEFGAIIRSLKK